MHDYYAAGVRDALEKLAIDSRGWDMIDKRYGPGMQGQALQKAVDTTNARDDRHRGYMGLPTGLNTSAVQPTEIPNTAIQEVTSHGATRQGVPPVGLQRTGNFSIPAGQLNQMSQHELYDRFGLPRGPGGPARDASAPGGARAVPPPLPQRAVPPPLPMRR